MHIQYIREVLVCSQRHIPPNNHCGYRLHMIIMVLFCLFVSLQSPNTSIISTISAMTPSLTSATPVAALHTPRPKRLALSRLPSFSAADLSNVGTNI